jgi:hypothetical protein
MKTFEELREQTNATRQQDRFQQNAKSAAEFAARRDDANKAQDRFQQNAKSAAEFAAINRRNADEWHSQNAPTAQARQNRQVTRNELLQRNAIRDRAFIGDHQLMSFDPISTARAYGDREAVRSDNLDYHGLRSAEIAQNWRDENERNAALDRQDWYATQPQNMSPEERFERGADASEYAARTRSRKELRKKLEDQENKMQQLGMTKDELPTIYLEPMWKKLNQ